MKINKSQLIFVCLTFKQANTQDLKTKEFSLSYQAIQMMISQLSLVKLCLQIHDLCNFTLNSFGICNFYILQYLNNHVTKTPDQDAKLIIMYSTIPHAQDPCPIQVLILTFFCKAYNLVTHMSRVSLNLHQFSFAIGNFK